MGFGVLRCVTASGEDLLVGRQEAAQEVGALVRKQGPLRSLFSMSFIQVDKESDFPLQNLPYGVFSTKEEVSNGKPCPWGVVIVPRLRLSRNSRQPGVRENLPA